MIRGSIFPALALALLLALVLRGAVAEDDLTEYGTIPFERKAIGSDEVPPAKFPHWVHRMNFRCYVCHDAIFQMKAGSDKITMDEIRAGKFCGVCHNGRIAFQVTFDTCPRCH